MAKADKILKKTLATVHGQQYKGLWQMCAGEEKRSQAKTVTTFAHTWWPIWYKYYRHLGIYIDVDINTKHSLTAAGLPPLPEGSREKTVSSGMLTPSSDALGHQG